MPERQSIGAPVTGERPAWQRFSRIPFALAVVKKTTGTKFLPQATKQFRRQLQLGGTVRRRIPLFSIHIIDGNERRLATHRQSNIPGHEFRIDAESQVRKSPPIVCRYKAW